MPPCIVWSVARLGSHRAKGYERCILEWFVLVAGRDPCALRPSPSYPLPFYNHAA